MAVVQENGHGGSDVVSVLAGMSSTVVVVVLDTDAPWGQGDTDGHAVLSAWPLARVGSEVTFALARA